eukprot:scaffold21190_cov61-Phaeocystis_antarctica.AAC.3
MPYAHSTATRTRVHCAILRPAILGVKFTATHQGDVRGFCYRKRARRCRRRAVFRCRGPHPVHRTLHLTLLLSRGTERLSCRRPGCSYTAAHGPRGRWTAHRPDEGSCRAARPRRQRQRPRRRSPQRQRPRRC